MYKLVGLIFLVIFVGCASSKIQVLSEVQTGVTVDKDKYIYIDKTFVETKEDKNFINKLEISLREHNFKLSPVLNKNVYLFSYRVRSGGGMQKIVVPVTSYTSGNINNTSFNAVTTSYKEQNKLYSVQSINMAISAYSDNKVIDIWSGRIILSDGETFNGNEKKYIDKLVLKLAKNIEISKNRLRKKKSIKQYRGCVIFNVRKFSDAGKLLNEITYRVQRICNNELIEFTNAVSVGKSNAYRNSFYEAASGGLPNEIKNDYYIYMDSKK